MGRLYQCDWCGAIYGVRKCLVLVDIDWNSESDERIFACPDHLPAHLVAKPRDPDTGEFLDDQTGQPLKDPLITGEEAEQMGIQPW